MSTLFSEIAQSSDVSTIISIFPMEVRESKPGLSPVSFTVAAGSPQNPVASLIGPGNYNIYIGDGRYAPTKTDSLSIAKSIVMDYCFSLLESTPDCHPGLIFLPGDVSVQQFSAMRLAGSDIKLLDLLIAAQNNWWKALTKRADAAWHKTRNAKEIGSLERLAARELNLSGDRHEWLRIDDALNAPPQKDCPACFQKIDLRAIKCPSCSAILNSDAFLRFQMQETLSASVAAISA